MTSQYKHLVLDLGGVLLEWDMGSLTTMTPKQFLTITNSLEWHNFERGKVSLQAACQVVPPGCLLLSPH